VTEKIRRYTLKQPARPQKQYRVRYEDELNSEQLEVVMAGEGPMLVIAGAGSGRRAPSPTASRASSKTASIRPTFCSSRLRTRRRAKC